MSDFVFGVLFGAAVVALPCVFIIIGIARAKPRLPW